MCMLFVKLIKCRFVLIFPNANNQLLHTQYLKIIFGNIRNNDSLYIYNCTYFSLKPYKLTINKKDLFNQHLCKCCTITFKNIKIHYMINARNSCFIRMLPKEPLGIFINFKLWLMIMSNP